MDVVLGDKCCLYGLQSTQRKMGMVASEDSDTDQGGISSGIRWRMLCFIMEFYSGLLTSCSFSMLGRNSSIFRQRSTTFRLIIQSWQPRIVLAEPLSRRHLLACGQNYPGTSEYAMRRTVEVSFESSPVWTAKSSPHPSTALYDATTIYYLLFFPSVYI